MKKDKFQIHGFRCLWILVAALYLTSCDEVARHFVNPSEYELLTGILEAGKSSVEMEVTDVSFSQDYKTFTVSTRLISDGPGFSFTDSSRVRTEVVEVIDGIRHTRRSTPRLIEMKSVESACVTENEMGMLLLVDKTLPQAELDKIRNYAREIRTVFNHQNLFVAFMDGGEVTRSLPLTDYVLDTYFRHSEQTYIYLFRAMQSKSEEIRRHKDMWQDTKRGIMITFADEKTYNEDSDIPYDPDHFRYEELLVGSAKPDSSFLADFVNMSPLPEYVGEEQNVPLVFCRRNGGDYITDFHWITLKRRIYESFRLDFPDNRFTFVNPDHKVYRGDRKQLTLNIYDRKTDKKVASFTTTVKLGHLYKPIIVNGHSILYVILQGVMLGLFILLLVYLVMQVIVPLIRYAVFLHKHVIRYAGANMSVNNQAVAESCYLCKAPFKPGERIVVKCEHTMHKECWDENDYHCPEYSDRCRHGSHYFNKFNIYDIRNASFYMKWILMAISAAILAWLGLTLYVHFGIDRLLPEFMRARVAQVPFFGLVMSLFLTFGLSVFTVSPRSLRSWGGIGLRMLVASAVSYAAFFITHIGALLFDISSWMPLIDALPWMISGFFIVVCSTKHTRVVYNKRLVIVSVVIGLLSMIAWNVFYQMSELDYRVILLLSVLFYYVSMAVSVATAAPRSERYFLKVEGAVKTMDVAIYKWFRNRPDRVVTLGKSVDCSLQLSWDVQSVIAPVQAEIRLIRKVPCLVAHEPGVFIQGKPVRIGKKVGLYHGKSFSIGRTTFTYIEKDR